MRRHAVQPPPPGASTASEASEAAAQPGSPETSGTARADGSQEASNLCNDTATWGTPRPVRPGCPPWERSARYR